MGLEVLEYELIEDRIWKLEETQLTSKGNEVSLELGHGVLSETSSAEADTLTEGADPLFAIVAMAKVLLIVGFKAKWAEFPTALVYFLIVFDLKISRHVLSTLDTLLFPIGGLIAWLECLVL